MTKKDAIAKLIKDNGGTAKWDEIYTKIGKYYKGAKSKRYWQHALRSEVSANPDIFKHISRGVIGLR